MPLTSDDELDYYENKIRSRVEGEMSDEALTQHIPQAPPPTSFAELADGKSAYVYNAKLLYDDMKKSRAERDHLDEYAYMYAGDEPTTAAEYAAWANDMYGWMNSNTGSLMLNWFKMSQRSPETVKAFVDNWDLYDNTDWTNSDITEWLPRGAMGVVMDIPTWLGIGAIAKTAGVAVPKAIMKRQFRDLLSRHYSSITRKKGAQKLVEYGKAMAIGAGESGVQGAAEGGTKGDLQQKAGYDVDPVAMARETAIQAAGFGAAGGAGIKGGLDLLTQGRP